MPYLTLNRPNNFIIKANREDYPHFLFYGCPCWNGLNFSKSFLHKFFSDLSKTSTYNLEISFDIICHIHPSSSWYNFFFNIGIIYRFKWTAILIKKPATPIEINSQAGFFYPEIYLLCNLVTNNDITLYYTKK